MSFFGELYLRSTRPLINVETTSREIRYLERVFGVGSRILDVGCGHGRHAAGLSASGRRVVGLEQDPYSLAQRERGFPAVCGDFRRPPVRRGSLDGAFAWYSTLFTSDEDGHRALLEQLSELLRPGGTFVFQSLPYEHASAQADDALTMTLPDGSVVEEQSAFDLSGWDRGQRRLTLPDGRILSAPYSIRYYPLRELKELFEAAGLEVKWVHGDLEGAPLSPESTELIMGAERRDG